METLAQKANHDFKNGDFKLFDENNNQIYYENSCEEWIKKKYDENHNVIYYEIPTGYKKLK